MEIQEAPRLRPQPRTPASEKLGALGPDFGAFVVGKINAIPPQKSAEGALAEIVDEAIRLKGGIDTLKRSLRGAKILDAFKRDVAAVFHEFPSPNELTPQLTEEVIKNAVRHFFGFFLEGGSDGKSFHGALENFFQQFGNDEGYMNLFASQRFQSLITSCFQAWAEHRVDSIFTERMKNTGVRNEYCGHFISAIMERQQHQQFKAEPWLNFFLDCIRHGIVPNDLWEMVLVKHPLEEPTCFFGDRLRGVVQEEELERQQIEVERPLEPIRRVFENAVSLFRLSTERRGDHFRAAITPAQGIAIDEQDSAPIHPSAFDSAKVLGNYYALPPASRSTLIRETTDTVDHSIEAAVHFYDKSITSEVAANSLFYWQDGTERPLPVDKKS